MANNTYIFVESVIDYDAETETSTPVIGTVEELVARFAGVIGDRVKEVEAVKRDGDKVNALIHVLNDVQKEKIYTLPDPDDKEEWNALFAA